MHEPSFALLPSCRIKMRGPNNGPWHWFVLAYNVHADGIAAECIKGKLTSLKAS
jgi:hypothetical protein